MAASSSFIFISCVMMLNYTSLWYQVEIRFRKLLPNFVGGRSRYSAQVAPRSANEFLVPIETALRPKTSAKTASLLWSVEGVVGSFPWSAEMRANQRVS